MAVVDVYQWTHHQSPPLLQNNSAVYAQSAFILNYDEGGQFFDHHWIPTPPLDADAETCSTVSVEGACALDVFYLLRRYIWDVLDD